MVGTFDRGPGFAFAPFGFSVRKLDEAVVPVGWPAVRVSLAYSGNCSLTMRSILYTRLYHLVPRHARCENCG